MKKVLEIRHLTKRYGQHLALDNVNLTLEKGEVYGLIGRNGAGKTTLIKVITKLIRPSQGSVSLFHSTSKSEWTHALKRVGSVIETPVALNHLNARQNLRYYCKIHHVPNPDKVIDEILDTVGLGHTGKKKFRSFSLGMKQRLGIAIALIAKPDLLILDEPINGLDPVAIKEFRQMIKKLSEEQGMTVLISSHILSELYQVSTRFGIIDHGHLIREITKDELGEGLQIIEVLEKCKLIPSRGEGRRLVQQGGVRVNEEKVTDIGTVITAEMCDEDGIIMIQKGKKTFHQLKVK